MCKARAAGFLVCVYFVCVAVSLVSAQGSNSAPHKLWQTLSGDPPYVVARGGFSGLFPDSSSVAYSLALMTSVPDLILWCDVQLTKDGVGICFPDVKLDNASDISGLFQNKGNTYLVNGVPTKGWFSVDFTINELANVFLTQGVFSRTNKFDGNMFPVQTVQDVFKENKPPGFWLNIQHDTFYTQHNASMRSFVLSASKSVIISYISSPEVGFLNSIVSRFRAGPTKLVFRFLGKNDIEPTTNQTYGSLSKNLTYIKTFASGILVPKSYIWPVDATQYLLPPTSIVLDAHKEGLEVFASEFSNDVPFSFNYSYDPIAEYLNFIDNGEFSVDGVLSDFPITPSEAIDCFAHLGKNASVQAKTLVISKNGASGDYPGCTDLAYGKAISDGADIIDCPVRMSQDGIPFCFSSINLIDGSSVAQSTFSNLAKTIPEIKSGSGIYTFSLNWSQIQNLTPTIANPYAEYQLPRNPKSKNAGKFMALSDFLALAKNTSSLTGVLIKIEYAAYLAEKQGLGVTDAVINALNKAGYDKDTTKRVLIQSTNSSVLMKLKQSSRYERVYMVDEAIRDAQNATIEDIKGFANAVVIRKTSVFPQSSLFLTGTTNVVQKLKSYNLSVYVETFSNEFVSQAWDFFSDATVEINSYVMGANVDGLITDFPQTAARYRRNRCLSMGKDTPTYMSPVQPGSLVQLITTQYLPPAEAPNPVLTAADVVEPPLPPVEKIPDSNRSTAAAPKSSNSQQRVTGSILISFLAALTANLFLI